MRQLVCSKFWGHFRNIVIVGLSSGFIAACESSSGMGGNYIMPTGAEERHPINVSRGVAKMHVPVYRGANALPPQLVRDLMNFLQQYNSSSAGVLTVARPVGGPVDIDSANVVSQVKNVLADSGVDPSKVRFSGYGLAYNMPAAVIISYDKYTAQSPQCGRNWPSNLGRNFGNKPYYEFGCSTQSNLAAMVANPRDLMAPSSMDPASSPRLSNVIKNYEQAK